MRRVAIVHEWLTSYAGSERALEEILYLFPDADLFSIVDFLPNEQRSFLQGKPVATSFIQRLPAARKHYRTYLPLMPLAVEQFDLSSYGLIISSSHAVAKGVLTQPGQLHLSYIYTPMRYAWHLQSQYLNGAGLDKGLKGMLARVTLHYIRFWDARTANGVDAFAAISDFVAKRVRKVYRRDAVVIYPPVNIEAFDVQRDKERFYLAVSRLVPYKRVDLIAEAFSRMPDKRLIVIGDGPDREKVRAKAGSNVTLLGYQSFDAVREHMKRACALVYVAEEDFGIAAVEAQACGTPVIAYGRGGLAETVLDGETGLLFQEQTTRSLIEAVSAFDQTKPRFDPVLIRRNAERFSRERFRREFSAFVEREYAAFLANGGVASIAHQRIPQTNQYTRVAGPSPDGSSNDLKEFAQADVEGTR